MGVGPTNTSHGKHKSMYKCTNVLRINRNVQQNASPLKAKTFLRTKYFVFVFKCSQAFKKPKHGRFDAKFVIVFVVEKSKLKWIRTSKLVEAKMSKLDINIRKAAGLKVSVTVEAVLNELDFLKSVNDGGIDFFYQPVFVQNALRRYRHFWIPFVVQHSASEDDDLKFAPPPGIANRTDNLP